MVDIPLQLGNFGNALMTGAHAGYYAQKGRLEADEERRRQAVQPDVAAAVGGDSAAMGRVAAGDPKTAVALTTMLARTDANKRAQIKDAAEYTARAANAVLQADPADRPAIYQQMYGEGAKLGYNMGSLPQTYTPALDSVLRSHRAQAVPIAEWFKTEADRQKAQDGLPTPMGGGPAAMPGAPGMAPQGGPRAAIAGIESTGQPNGGYGAVGPVATAQGNRAYGKYQVLDSNIGPWTAEILGRPMSPQEFLASPEAQDKVFDAKFGQYVQQFGSQEAAARAWFGGPGSVNNPGARDVNGMSVAQYENRFRQGMGGQAAPGVPGPIASALPGPPAGVVPAGPPPAAMPGAPTGLIQSGPPPAQMPSPQVPGQIAQGDGGGQPQPPPDVQGLTRNLQLPPGARMMGIKGVPVVKDGNVLIVHPDGTQDWMPLPPRKEPGPPKPTGPAGTFAGSAIEAQYANVLEAGATDPAVRGTFAYAQAYAHAAAPVTRIGADGKAETIQPDVRHIAPPTFAVGGAPPAATPQPAPPSAGQPALSAPSTVELPGGQKVTVTDIPGAQSNKPLNNDQANAATFADRMRNSNAILDNLADQGAKPGGRLNEKIPLVGNYRQTPEYQDFKQARDDFINAQLRKESGAAISDAEYKRADEQYFPQPGDKPSVIAQKAKNRQLAVEGMIRGAGPSYKPATTAEGARDQFNIDKIPQPARARLKANPGERAQFDEIFGAGAADKVLGR